MTDRRDAATSPEPVHVFDQTNGILAADPEPDGDAEMRSRGRAGEDATTLGAHQTITGMQGGF